MKIEKMCISKSDTCDRKCNNCVLVQDADELLDMYDFVIRRLEDEEQTYSHRLSEEKDS